MVKPKIDSNGNIYIKPARTIEKHTLQMRKGKEGARYTEPVAVKKEKHKGPTYHTPTSSISFIKELPLRVHGQISDIAIGRKLFKVLYIVNGKKHLVFAKLGDKIKKKSSNLLIADFVIVDIEPNDHQKGTITHRESVVACSVLEVEKEQCKVQPIIKGKLTGEKIWVKIPASIQSRLKVLDSVSIRINPTDKNDRTIVGFIPKPKLLTPKPNITSRAGKAEKIKKVAKG